VSSASNPFAALEEAAARQVAEETAAKALASARARLILGRDGKSIFFATLALRLTPEPNWEVETMATDGRVLAYGPRFVTALSPDELLGVVAHEVMHNALAHPSRQRGRDHGLWNVACDLAINPLLVEAGFTLPADRLLPGEARYQHLPPGRSAEEYYAALASDRPGQDREPGGAADGIGANKPDPGGCGTVMAPKDGPADARQTEAEWQVAVAQAHQAAAGRGPLPGGLDRTVHNTLHPRADWRSILREFVSSHARNDYSWARPNRRLISQGLYLPGLHSEELGDVVLAVDTSGSIDEKLLGVFAAEVNAVLASFDCSVTVLYHDTDVQKVQTWRSADGPLVLDPVGGGGTSHVCVFDWVGQAGMCPACVVCLTDLDTEFPAAIPPVPVLWAVAGDRSTDPPFGRVVSLSPDHPPRRCPCPL
jgi:predicted metal-dependent peptidase